MDHICITNETTEVVNGERGKAHSGSECWRFQFHAWGALVGPEAPQCIMAGMTWNILEGHSHLNYSGFSLSVSAFILLGKHSGVELPVLM